MEIPISIEFTGDCLSALSQSLLAVRPQEGCALLIGNYSEYPSIQKKNTLQIQMIWPCCNIWEPGIFNIVESKKEINNFLEDGLSKKNRFAIAPQEQLLAMRWARKHQLRILGSAHSHPNGNSTPSSIDCIWALSPGLMVIVGKFGEIRAWWMKNEQTFRPKEVAILNLK